MSDAPSELRVVVDRSCEAISISNNLPSTSTVFPHDMIGTMDQDMPNINMEHQLEKYMVDKDDAIPMDDEDVGHMKGPTTTTPNSYERYYKGNNIGVVGDAMFPLVDMMTCDDMHAMDSTFDVAYARFIFPCDTLPLDNIHHMVHVDHVKLIDCEILP